MSGPLRAALAIVLTALVVELLALSAFAALATVPEREPSEPWRDARYATTSSCDLDDHEFLGFLRMRSGRLSPLQQSGAWKLRAKIERCGRMWVRVVVDCHYPWTSYEGEPRSTRSVDPARYDAHASECRPRVERLLEELSGAGLVYPHEVRRVGLDGPLLSANVDGATFDRLVAEPRILHMSELRDSFVR